jgi:hypothetical protein
MATGRSSSYRMPEQILGLLRKQALFAAVVSVVNIVKGSFGQRDAILFAFFRAFSLFLLSIFYGLFNPGIQLDTLDFHLRLSIFDFLQIDSAKIVRSECGGRQ